MLKFHPLLFCFVSGIVLILQSQLTTAEYGDEFRENDLETDDGARAAAELDPDDGRRNEAELTVHDVDGEAEDAFNRFSQSLSTAHKLENAGRTFKVLRRCIKYKLLRH